jgi:hypothetical protein
MRHKLFSSVEHWTISPVKPATTDTIRHFEAKPIGYTSNFEMHPVMTYALWRPATVCNKYCYVCHGFCVQVIQVTVQGWNSQLFVMRVVRIMLIGQCREAEFTGSVKCTRRVRYIVTARFCFLCFHFRYGGVWAEMSQSSVVQLSSSLGARNISPFDPKAKEPLWELFLKTNS